MLGNFSGGKVKGLGLLGVWGGQQLLQLCNVFRNYGPSTWKDRQADVFIGWKDEIFIVRRDA